MNRILDSGAFSAWNQGKHIDIEEYVSFCEEHHPMYTNVVNLDKIPGSPGVKIPQSEIEKAAQQGWMNYMRMLKSSVPSEKIIHVFHQGENFKWLKRLVAHPKSEYIGLSPANDKTIKDKMDWLDDCMEYVCDENGMPIIKFHGFAVTSLLLMRRYPWFSVDSATWIQAARTGGILMPEYNGSFFFGRAAVTINISSRAHMLGIEVMKSYWVMSPLIQERVRIWVDLLGIPLGSSRFERRTAKTKEEQWAKKGEIVEIIEVEGITNSAYYRALANFLFLTMFQETLPKWPFPFKSRKKRGLFKLGN